MRLFFVYILVGNIAFYKFALANVSNSGVSIDQIDNTKPSNRMEAKNFEAELDCQKILSQFPGVTSKKNLVSACSKIQTLDKCYSVQKKPIFHYSKNSTTSNSKKILVLSLIHGDEFHAGTVGRYWMERLEEINPRNSWRVVPVLNPDGLILKTRMNANKVDLNRNFPTKDWNELAQTYWHTKTGSNPRRFPGEVAGSEPEVQCALEHISDYQPDFVMSIHTPLKVLDYDGPKVKPPVYSYLPWKSLGHFPGSLGRYMWFERFTPVLTVELKETPPDSLTPIEKLQDVIGELVKYEIKVNK